jgi:hypothetical protein
MKTLIGLLILQGIVQKPEKGLYFSKRESIVMPFFSQIMTEKIPLLYHTDKNLKI